jgi:hypothetical protein
MNVRRIGLAAFAASTGLLILAPMASSAQDEERRRAVGDWLVEDVFDDNGGRILRMTRESGDYRLDYHLNLGGGLPEDLSQGFLVWRLNCGQGGEESLGGGTSGIEAAAVRRRLTDYLARCDTPESEAADLMRDFDRGFSLLSEWRAEAEAVWGDVENAAAAAEAAADSMELNMTDDMGMTDMNSTAGEAMHAAIYENATDVPEPGAPK